MTEASSCHDPHQDAADTSLPAVRALLTQTLHLGERGAALTAQTALLGSLPELDSMAVATILTALEDRFDIIIDDDDVSAETFETLGSLAAFIDAKRAS